MVLLLGLLPPLSLAADESSKLLIVINSDEGVYQDIVHRLSKSPAIQTGSYQVATLGDQENIRQLLEPADAILTIGTRAAEEVYRHKPTTPVLSALITKSGFTHLAEKHYASLESALAKNVSAIFLDQPLDRLFRLGKLLLPDSSHTGVLTTDSFPAGKAPRLPTAISRDSTLEYVVIGDDSRPINTLSPVFSRSDFVIALPGKKSVTVSAARWILEISSLSRTPVIAYSRKYARSGALAAIYTSPENVALQIGRVLADTDSLQIGSAHIHAPTEFSVEINIAVANALGIAVNEPLYYQQQIRRLEGGQ